MKIIISTLLILLVSTSIYAQESVKDQMYVWDDWSGGLSTQISPFKLQKNQSEIAENVRFGDELGAFAKRDKIVTYGTAGTTDPILGMHRFYINDGTKVLLVNYSDHVAKGTDSTGAFTDILTLGTGDRRAQWETWHNIAIGTDGYNQPYKYDGTSASATYLGSPLALDAGSGSGPVTGNYTYKTVCYTATYSLSLGAPSNTYTADGHDVNLSMIPICPDTFLGEDVIGRKIYRTESGGATYKLLSNGTIANNTAVTLVDSDADAALGATLSVTSTMTPPKGKLIIIHKNRLWIANDPSHPSRIYYSDDSSHDYFPSTNYFDVRRNDGDEITFVKNLLGKLTVGKNNTIQKIYTDGETPATDWEISDPFSFVGCHAIYSAVNTPIGIFYLSNNGIYVFNGQYSTMVSDNITPEIKDINPTNFPNVWGEYSDNKYYMTYTSRASGATSNNRVLVYDLNTKAFSIDLLNINSFTVFRSGSDVEALYSGASDSGNIYAHNETIKEVIHKTHSDFAGTFDDMRYIPVEVGGVSTSPVLELAWDATIDSVTASIDSVTWGVIDRPSTGGSYTSQALNLSASDFDKVYWNESVPATGGTVRFRFRTAATEAGLTGATWSSYVSYPSGSDISAVSGNVYAQYYISMDTVDIAYTPTIYKSNNYVVRMTYNTVGQNAETSIPIHVRSGWSDFGYPGYKKTLIGIYVYYESDSTGTLSVKLESSEGVNDTFNINLQDHPSEYAEFFVNGIVGELFRLDITEDSLNNIKVQKVICRYNVEPL